MSESGCPTTEMAMPELPEVEFGRRVAASVAEGRTIRQVRCQEDPIVLPDGPEAVGRALTGREVLGVHRWGKRLWFELDRLPYPSFHFGMTGAFRIQDQAPLPLAHGPSPEPEVSWPPKYWKIELTFTNGQRLAMTNSRRLGRIRLHSDPAGIKDGLGFDPWLALPSVAEFEGRMNGRTGTLKGLLLDQGFAAGVGNWVADEVLHQARLDPRRRVSELSSAERRRLHEALGEVVRTAVEANADPSQFPPYWIFHRRWRTQKTDSEAGLRFDRVAGRTTCWNPSVQT